MMDQEPITLLSQVETLLQQQKATWPMVKENYDRLKQVESKCFPFGPFKLIVQHNPGRIRSSCAKTDEQSIGQRPCFLCAANRPEEQTGISALGRYAVMINPFPIFREHLTIALNDHLPQYLEPWFADMLFFSRELPGFTVFYNGPQCGASAPDHFHFQAGTGKVMPSDTELGPIARQQGALLFRDETTTIQAVGKTYLRKFFLLTSGSPAKLTAYFKRLLQVLGEGTGEPMMNVHAAYENGQWQVAVFPREKQRPWQFYADGTAQIVMSPAAVELGGLVILPRKNDFDRITKDDLADMLTQVTISDERFNEAGRQIKQQS